MFLKGAPDIIPQSYLMKSRSNSTSNRSKGNQHHTNFVEALKSIGSSTVNSVKKDLISGSIQDSVTGQSTSFDQSPSNSTHEQGQSNWLKEREQQLQKREKQQHHKEMILTPVFDRRQEEVKNQIKALREELAELAKDLGKLGHSVQKAIDEEVENPGTYHLHFFEKLRRFIINLRKQVSESPNWLEVSQQRKVSQQKYWGNVKKSGTKYMLSHDRSVATQTG